MGALYTEEAVTQKQALPSCREPVELLKACIADPPDRLLYAHASPEAPKLS